MHAAGMYIYIYIWRLCIVSLPLLCQVQLEGHGRLETIRLLTVAYTDYCGPESIHGGPLNCPHFFGYWERGIRLIPCDNINSRWFLCLFRLPSLPLDGTVDSPRGPRPSPKNNAPVSGWRTSCKRTRWLIWTTRSGGIEKLNWTSASISSVCSARLKWVSMS